MGFLKEQTPTFRQITKEGTLSIDKIGLLEYLLDHDEEYPEDLCNYKVVEVSETSNEIFLKFRYDITEEIVITTKLKKRIVKKKDEK